MRHKRGKRVNLDTFHTEDSECQAFIINTDSILRLINGFQGLFRVTHRERDRHTHFQIKQYAKRCVNTMCLYSGLIACNTGIQAKFIVIYPTTKAFKHYSHLIVSTPRAEENPRKVYPTDDEK